MLQYFKRPIFFYTVKTIKLLGDFFDRLKPLIGMFLTLFQTFDWNPGEKSVVLSAFFWGYVITNIPAGQLAQRFGPKRFLAGSMLTSSSLDVLLPPAATLWGWPGACAVRVLQGLAQVSTCCISLRNRKQICVYDCFHHVPSSWLLLNCTPCRRFSP